MESSLSKPIKYFLGNPTNILAKEEKYHNEKLCFSLKLIDYEIANIIEPVLASSQIDKNIKERLFKKKQILLKFQEKIVTLSFDNYALNLTKLKNEYMQLINQASKEGDNITVERLKERARPLVEEDKALQSKKSNITNKPLEAFSENDVHDFIQDYDALSIPQQIAILKKRKDEYYNLSCFLLKEVIPTIENEEEKQKRTKRLKEYLIPLIKKADAVIKTLECGTQAENITKFLKTELVEVGPETLHEMSLAERQKKIDELYKLIEQSISNENNYKQIHLESYPNGTEMPGQLSKKIRESERYVSEYSKFLDYLEKLKLDSQKWVPLPLFSIVPETRPVILLNSEIKPGILRINFKSIARCSDHKYFLKFMLDIQGQMKTFQTNNSSNMIWNDIKEIEIGNDAHLYKKDIQIVLYESGLFSNTKKAENKLSLANFANSNNISGSICIGHEKYEISYDLKIREPINKIGKTTINHIVVKTKYQPFNKNTPTQPTQSQQTRSQQISSSNLIPTGQNINLSVSAGNTTTTQVTNIQQYNNNNNNNPTTEPYSNSYKAESQLPQKQEPIEEENKESKPQIEKKSQSSNLARCFIEIKKYESQGLSTLPSDAPEGLTIEYYKNPADPEKMSLTFLKKFAEELEKAKAELLAECRIQDQKNVSAMWNKAFKQATIIEMQINEGAMDIGDYKQKLITWTNHDQYLFNIYKSQGYQDHLGFIIKKIKSQEEELKELEDMENAE